MALLTIFINNVFSSPHTVLCRDGGMIIAMVTPSTPSHHLALELLS